MLCVGCSSLGAVVFMFVFSVHLLGCLPVQFVLMASFDDLRIRALVMHVFSCAFYARYGRCGPSLPLVVIADLSSGTQWVNGSVSYSSRSLSDVIDSMVTLHER